MTTRYEGAAAASTTVSILTAGSQIGDDTVPEGQVALVLGYDEVFYLEGTAKEISTLLGNAQTKLALAVGKSEEDGNE